MNDLRHEHYREIAPTLSGKRLDVYRSLQRFGPCTPCELAGLMGWDKCSVRPRVTELLAMGRAQETGVRRNGQHEFLAVGKVQQLELLSA